VFSGDKLLGGPQAGIVLGRADLVARMRASPLARALRVDKLTLAALDWTLRALLDGNEREIPVLRMLLAEPEALEACAERIARELVRAGWAKVSVEHGTSPVGGGSLPEFALPGAFVRIELGERAAGELAERLRRGDPPVLVRVQRGAVCIDRERSRTTSSRRSSARWGRVDEVPVLAKVLACSMLQCWC